MQPHNTPKDPIAVEYDANGKRTTKEFKDHFAARRFYVAKLKEGRNPKVKKV